MVGVAPYKELTWDVGSMIVDMSFWWMPIAAIVLGIFLQLYQKRNSAGKKWPSIFKPRMPERTPMEDLQIRYLRGEIGQEEFEAEQRELTGES
jgi:uncharacterized membrane protein